MKVEFKACPRCGNEFACHSASITSCQCQGLQLNNGQAAYLTTRYDDCLCLPCLDVLVAEYNRRHMA